MGGFFGPNGTNTSGGGSSAARLGPALAFVSPAGGAVAAAPAGFNSLVGRLLVTLPSGNATWISLTGGTDGQLLDVRNRDGANTLTLPAAQWGGAGDLALGPSQSVLAYYNATATRWELTSP